MPSIRDVVQQQDKSDQRFERAIVVIRCKLIGVDNVTSAEVTGRPGYVWVRRYNDAYGVFQVFNGGVVNPIAGVPVLVELSSGQHKYKVIGIDYGLAGGNDYDIGTPEDVYLKHASTHEWSNNTPGTDAVSVYVRALIPLKTYPYSGLTVGVAEGRYSYNGKNQFFGNTYISLSNYTPAAGYTVFVLLSLNPETQALVVTVGDVADAALAPSFPIIPPGYIPSSYVQLSSTTTTVTEAIITDARVILHAPTVSMQEIYHLINDLERELTIHQYYGDVI